jgi:hypothetical protein
VAVVGGEVAAAVPQGEIDHAAELVAGADQAGAVVLDVQVEDDAGVGLLRPGQEALLVRLDQADGAVDDVDARQARVSSRWIVCTFEQP